MGVVANNVSTPAGVRALVGLVCIGKRMQNKRKKKKQNRRNKSREKGKKHKKWKKNNATREDKKQEENPNTNYIKPHVAVEVINWLMF